MSHAYRSRLFYGEDEEGGSEDLTLSVRNRGTLHEVIENGKRAVLRRLGSIGKQNTGYVYRNGKNEGGGTAV